MRFRPLGFMALLSALFVLGCGDGQVSGFANSNGVATSHDAVTAGKCPRGATVLGIDVSSYQGNVNWGAVRAAGYPFAIARVSDGFYQDAYFAQNWTGMKAAGMLRGAYQFFEPGSDAVAQANLVISKVGRLGPGDLPVMLDMEVTNGLSGAAITAQIHRWVNAIQAGTGKTPFIYTGAYFWDGSVASSDFANLALDVAWYGTNCPGTPNAWSNWTFHQFTDRQSVPGVSGGVDADVFNGDLAALQAFAGGGGGPSCTVVGPILSEYNALGGVHSVLGACTTSELLCADGAGRYNHFAHGSIYWSPATGAHEIHGLINDKWVSFGWETGLGYPLTDEKTTPDRVGAYNHFSKDASIYWTAATGTHAVKGPIRDRWAALGWETRLGYPTTDETVTPDKVGAYNHFSKDASIYWTAATGARAVQGPIRDKWAALGSEKGLGYPTVEAVVLADHVSELARFQRGAIIAGARTGVHCLTGPFLARWDALGRGGCLGLPTQDTGASTRIASFEHGTLALSASGVAKESCPALTADGGTSAVGGTPPPAPGTGGTDGGSPGAGVRSGLSSVASGCSAATAEPSLLALLAVTALALGRLRARAAPDGARGRITGT